MYCGALGCDFGGDYWGDLSESVPLAGEAAAVMVIVEALGDLFFLVTLVQPSSVFLG